MEITLDRRLFKVLCFPFLLPRDKPLGDNGKQPHLLAEIRKRSTEPPQ